MLSNASPAALTPAQHDDQQAVLQAAAALVAAFASNDSAAYFAAFSEDASFVFHSCATVLTDLDAYRQLWSTWQADGFAVLACTSSKPLLTLQGDCAIFVHEVSTRLRIAGSELHSEERETIVFRRQPGSRRWLACHEHLSLLPTG
ncbi:YybH family protein [Pseudomonas sp. EA_105y_Pfl2_R69]|jgi:ketosteroid isomerase-like protein|uniref:YybH family protein n=1 Tax=Pseudomonas sp. EA_105y_Pfl2_R69 TaxID=3088683 RepID=UPI0030DCF93D